MSSAGATLQGSFSGETGTITEVGFYYGTTSDNLGTKVVATGTSSPFSKSISGLNPGTTYYYKAYVIESNQTVYSDIVASFTTPSVTTVAAIDISTSGATLTASFTGLPTDGLPIVGAFFRYGESRSNLSKTVYDNNVNVNSANGSFSAPITSLKANTYYYYQAVISLNGVDIEGSIESFKTTSWSTDVDRMYLDNYEIPAISVTAYSSYTETFGDTNYYTYTTSNSNERVVSHTFKYNGNTLHNYSLLYDKTKRAALWVAFTMSHDVYPWLVGRSDSWKADPGIPEDWQPNLSDAYADSDTYSRGHQAASNDRRTTTNQTKQTTYFSNMTPQLSIFNGGAWNSLEGDVQKIGNATTGNDMLYVVTGPIFGANYGTTNDKSGNACAVPTQYFKCIMKVTLSNGYPIAATGAAYLLDHANNAQRQNVKIDYIEDLTRFDFFANIPTELQNTAENETHPTTYFPMTAF